MIAPISKHNHGGRRPRILNTPAEIECLWHLYGIHKSTAKLAAIFNVVDSTIRLTLKRNGYPLQGRGGNNHGKKGRKYVNRKTYNLC